MISFSKILRQLPLILTLCVFTLSSRAQTRPESHAQTPSNVAAPANSGAPLNLGATDAEKHDQAGIDQANALREQAMSMLSVFSADGKPVSNPMDLLQSPDFQERLKQLGELQKMLENPAVRKYVRVVTNSEVVSGLQGLMAKPKEKHMHLLFAQLAFFILFALFRTWHLAKTTGFFKRIVWSLGLFVIWIGCISFVIPTATLGWDYAAFLGAIGRAFMSA